MWTKGGGCKCSSECKQAGIKKVPGYIHLNHLVGFFKQTSCGVFSFLSILP